MTGARRKRYLRRLQAVCALRALATGLTAPYLFVYLTQVRHLDTAVATVLFTVQALSALGTLPLAGRWADTRGRRHLLAPAGTGIAAVATAVLPFTTTTQATLATAAVLSIGLAASQPAESMMLARCTTARNRSLAYAAQFWLKNLGTGAGAVIGGLTADAAHPSTFTLLFGLNAVLMLLLAMVLTTVRPPPVAGRVVHGRPPGPSFRRLLGHRPIRHVLLLSAVTSFTCYGQFESGLVAYATEIHQITPGTLGAGIMANTAVIGLGQFGIARLVERHRRHHVLALVGLVWLLAWTVVWAGGLLRRNVPLAATSIVIAYALLGVGEMLLAPAMGPLPAELAPARMLGCSTAAFAMVGQVAIAAGPAFAGVLIGARLHGQYLAALVGCTVLITALGWRSHHELTPAQNRMTASEPADR
ncbi:MFS transporter [Streptomyces sp. NPDC051909]|uniref:MFS transporter n=1 Tax=Streptomyces sp. NPDC051909 TaxID=3154944 RepID=UPI00341DF8A6